MTAPAVLARLAEARRHWSADAVVAFVVCHVVDKPIGGSRAPEHDNGHALHAVVYGDYLQCVEEVGAIHSASRSVPGLRCGPGDDLGGAERVGE